MSNSIFGILVVIVVVVVVVVVVVDVVMVVVGVGVVVLVVVGFAVVVDVVIIRVVDFVVVVIGVVGTTAGPASGVILNMFIKLNLILIKPFAVKAVSDEIVVTNASITIRLVVTKSIFIAFMKTTGAFIDKSKARI